MKKTYCSCLSYKGSFAKNYTQIEEGASEIHQCHIVRPSFHLHTFS